MNKNKNLTIEEILNLAVKNHLEGKTDVAQVFYNQVLMIDPNHSQALNNIAIIFTKLKEYEKAKKCYEKTIEIKPNYADVHNNLGIMQDELKNYKEAHRAIKEY